ncbi:TatD family hydrolase [Microvirga arsenatis]|uniref:YchF/TatD family DNA exonuclease n=1 Tax=Microvirga arsenatis TaxID=2692265 RepID=A0ABW9Z6Y5_9HYPH|nr:TatD family hydrolase [Microvirga arsenatis]NBJ13409.1 YchF/TatD family DNA exonuclease [Microvirga arsenatis]NBJ26973.1 YchF/TatD family DNA exonuclease [Microvirga arsenatis]
MLVDSHCHLDFPDFQSRLPEVLSAAAAAGVGRMVTISTHVARYETYRSLAEAHTSVFCTVGTHPHNAALEPDVPAERIVDLSRHPRCVAIGEAGLDYHYDKSPRDVQQRVFRTHIEAAREAGLPLVVHARNADEDMIRILSDEMGRGRFDAVLHCFSSGEKLAQVGVELGLYVSFSGILTFRNSEEIRRIAASVPHHRLLVETDAPYLAPVPHRGKTNEPAFVAHTARVLAEVIGASPEAVAELTTANFYRLFSKAAAADAENGRALAS